MKAVLSFCFLSLLCSSQTSGQSDTYRGAVVEFNPNVTKDEAARAKANVASYIKFMEDAKAEGADIIVFPENGLILRTIQSPVPDPKDGISPCDSTFATTEILKNLSCAAKENKIYSVVNLLEKRACSKDDKDCPPGGFYVYNTNVGFDRKGVVIARYSKFNLYDETVNKTKAPEISIFETDFGVRFGMFTCFDIMFPTPALALVQKYNITDFVYTTYWFSELPFLTALQTQRGFAETHNVNFLASGVNWPTSATFGSGIYNGKHGQLVQTMPEKATSELLIADVPKMTPNKKQHVNAPLYKRIVHYDVEPSSSDEGMEMLRDHMHLFHSEVIPTGKRFEHKICGGDNFCCYFKGLINKLSSNTADLYTPRAIAFNGIRKFGASFKGGVQCCGVVLCRGPDIMNCTSRVKKSAGLFEFSEIQVKGDFKMDDSFQIPTTLTDGEKLEPLTSNKYEFKKKRKDGMMEVSIELIWPVNNLQAFGIWGRDFTKDAGSGGSTVLSSPGFYLVFVMTLVFGWNFGVFTS